MADIAAVFHWPPEALDRLDIVDLLDWREAAVERWNRMHGGKDK